MIFKIYIGIFTRRNQLKFLIAPGNPLSSAAFILEQQTLDYFMLSESESYSDIEEASNPSDSSEPQFEINYFYNMLKSLIVFFSGVIKDSRMFDTEVMQIFKIEPRSTNNNAIAIDKVVKGLMDFDDAFKRAQEFFNENSTADDLSFIIVLRFGQKAPNALITRCFLVSLVLDNW